MSAPATVTAGFILPTTTVNTTPAGLALTVDGTNYTAPQTFQWAPSSTHTIAVASTQAGPAGTQYVFASWSDGLAVSHTVNSPAANVTVTAHVTTADYLTTQARPVAG